jgi:hypothetical protein
MVSWQENLKAAQVKSAGWLGKDLAAVAASPVDPAGQPGLAEGMSPRQNQARVAKRRKQVTRICKDRVAAEVAMMAGDLLISQKVID